MNNGRAYTNAASRLVALYILILGAERCVSLGRIICAKSFFASAYDSFIDTIAFESVFITLFLLFMPFNRGFFSSVFGGVREVGYTALAVTSGVLLISGMLHTEYTFAPVQFVSYGALIGAMFFYTLRCSRTAKSRFKLWYSFAYLVVFSMAIPVVYRSNIEYKTVFHVVETVAALTLVVLFTLMMNRVFNGKAEDLLGWLPFALMVVFDAAILVMRWHEEVNTFVLIFASAATVMFIAGKIIFALLDGRSKK